MNDRDRELKDFCNKHGVHGDAYECPTCEVEEQFHAALDKIAQLEFEVAELEEKIRLLEAAL